MKLSKLASEIVESPTLALNEEARLLRERGGGSGDDSDNRDIFLHVVLSCDCYGKPALRKRFTQW